MAETELQTKRRKEILEAASRVFSSVGFFRADMNEIAKQANIAKGTVYLYFPSKKKLFLALITEGLNHLSDIIEAEVKSIDNPIEEMNKSIAAYMNFFNNNQPFYRILLHPDKEVKDDIEKLWQNYTLSKIPSIEDTLKKGVSLGLFNKMNTTNVSYMILGMIDQTLGLWISKIEKEPIENVTNQILDFIYSGITK
jgi:AcrR family transcriptional regulator